MLYSIPFCPIVFLASVYRSESLGCFKASGFWYSFITGFSPELLWIILWLPLVWDILGYHSTGLVLHQLQKALDGGLDSSQVGQTGPLGPPTLGKWVGSTPLRPCPPGGFTLACCKGMDVISPTCRGQISFCSIQGEARPVFLGPFLTRIFHLPKYDNLERYT